MLQIQDMDPSSLMSDYHRLGSSPNTSSCDLEEFRKRMCLAEVQANDLCRTGHRSHRIGIGCSLKSQRVSRDFMKVSSGKRLLGDAKFELLISEQ